MKKRLNKKSYILVIASFALTCTQSLLDPEPANDFRTNFQAFWEDVDRHYIFFDIKKSVNWDSVYEANMVKKMEMQDPYSTEFWVNLLEPFHDFHFRIGSNRRDKTINSRISDMYGTQKSEKGNITFWSSWYMEDFEKYMSDYIQYFNESVFIGRICDSIGYMCVDYFADEYSDAEMNLLFKHISKFDKLIIDIRENPGGTRESAEKLAGIFFTNKTHYGYEQTKAGAGRVDYASPVPIFINPSPNNYNGKVILLINHYTCSAAELFALAFKRHPSAKIMGINSCGSVSGVFTHELPNGWYYSIPVIRNLDLDKNPIEDKGITPEIIINPDDPDSAWDSRDEILDSAISIFQNKG